MVFVQRPAIDLDSWRPKSIENDEERQFNEWFEAAVLEEQFGETFEDADCNSSVDRDQHPAMSGFRPPLHCAASSTMSAAPAAATLSTAAGAATTTGSSRRSRHLNLDTKSSQIVRDVSVDDVDGDGVEDREAEHRRGGCVSGGLRAAVEESRGIAGRRLLALHQHHHSARPAVRVKSACVRIPAARRAVVRRPTANPAVGL